MPGASYLVLPLLYLLSGCSSSSTPQAVTAATPAAAPLIAPSGTSYNVVRSVTITDATPGAAIHYTLDGTPPTASSPVYSGALTLSSTTAVNAIATASGYTNSSISTATVSIPTTAPTPWDKTTVAGQVSYTEEIPFSDPSLANAGFVNVVTQGGVDNTGATDAACALQTLLNNATLVHNNVQYGTTFPWQDLIVYLPNGTYLLSNPACLPLVKNYTDGTPDYGMVLLGESQAGVTLKLGANVLPPVQFVGNTVAGSRTISNIASTAGLRVNQHLEGPTLRAGTTIASVSATSVGLSYSAATTATGAAVYALTPIVFTQSTLQLVNGSEQQFGNEAFHNVLENFTLDLASNSGNTGAIGISFLASNMGAVRNVTIRGDASAAALGTGIDMTRGALGPALVENVSISGFKRGLDVADNCCSITVEHVTFDNQLSGAIFNADNLITANALWIKSGQGATAINNTTGNGFIVMANSRIDQTGSALVANLSGGAISIRNSIFASVQSNLGASSGTLNGVLKGQSWSAGNNFLLPLTQDTPVLPYDPPAQWFTPASGVSAAWTEQVTTPVDATAAINAALSCRNGNTSTLYLPHGIYYISSPIKVPSYVDRIVGMNSTLRVLPSAAANFPSGSPVFEVLSNSPGACPYAPTVVIERIAFDPTGTALQSPVSIQADAPADNQVARTLVVRDIFSVGMQQLHRLAGGGETYLENTSGSPIVVEGSNWVLARQFNSESPNYGAARVTNNGAPLWILGYKTEGPTNIVNSLNTAAPFATSEIIGGFFYTAPGTDATAPSTTCAASASTNSSVSSTPAMYILQAGSRVEASFIEEVEPTGTQTVGSGSYPFYLYGAGTCQGGAGSSTNPYSGAIQRMPLYAAPTEAGFIVPELLAAP